MTSKAERKRRKKAAQANNLGIGLAEIPKRQPNGQARDRAEMPTDPRKTGLEARCRLMGVDATSANMKALTGQHMATPIGQVMERLCADDEIQRLWSTWQGFCAAERTYRVRYLGQTGAPKGAAIAMVPDRIETDQSHSVDLRDSDERDRDAVSAWMQWRGWLMHLSADDQRRIHDAETGAGGALWADAGPTGLGIVTLQSLRRFRSVVDRRT